MKYTKMEFIRDDLAKRGIVDNGKIGEINPREIELTSLAIKISEQNGGYMLLEDFNNHLNIMSDNKHTILDYVVGVFTYN